METKAFLGKDSELLTLNGFEQHVIKTGKFNYVNNGTSVKPIEKQEVFFTYSENGFEYLFVRISNDTIYSVINKTDGSTDVAVIDEISMNTLTHLFEAAGLKKQVVSKLVIDSEKYEQYSKAINA